MGGLLAFSPACTRSGPSLQFSCDWGRSHRRRGGKAPDNARSLVFLSFGTASYWGLLAEPSNHPPTCWWMDSSFRSAYSSLMITGWSVGSSQRRTSMGFLLFSVSISLSAACLSTNAGGQRQVCPESPEGEYHNFRTAASAGTWYRVPARAFGACAFPGGPFEGSVRHFRARAGAASLKQVDTWQAFFLQCAKGAR